MESANQALVRSSKASSVDFNSIERVFISSGESASLENLFCIVSFRISNFAISVSSFLSARWFS